MTNVFSQLQDGLFPPGLDVIGELGFDGIELIVNAPQDLKEFWTNARIDRLNQKLQQKKFASVAVRTFPAGGQGLLEHESCGSIHERLSILRIYYFYLKGNRNVWSSLK
jgi:hypothetical protein